MSTNSTTLAAALTEIADALHAVAEANGEIASAIRDELANSIEDHGTALVDALGTLAKAMPADPDMGIRNFGEVSLVAAICNIAEAIERH